MTKQCCHLLPHIHTCLRVFISAARGEMNVYDDLMFYRTRTWEHTHASHCHKKATARCNYVAFSKIFHAILNGFLNCKFLKLILIEIPANFKRVNSLKRELFAFSIIKAQHAVFCGKDEILSDFLVLHKNKNSLPCVCVCRFVRCVLRSPKMLYCVLNVIFRGCRQ